MFLPSFGKPCSFQSMRDLAKSNGLVLALEPQSIINVDLSWVGAQCCVMLLLWDVLWQDYSGLCNIVSECLESPPTQGPFPVLRVSDTVGGKKTTIQPVVKAIPEHRRPHAVIEYVSRGSTSILEYLEYFIGGEWWLPG